jgi:hypothetical protein
MINPQFTGPAHLMELSLNGVKFANIINHAAVSGRPMEKLPATPRTLTATSSSLCGIPASASAPTNCPGFSSNFIQGTAHHAFHDSLNHA